jgi:hypothetical protein
MIYFYSIDTTPPIYYIIINDDSNYSNYTLFTATEEEESPAIAFLFPSSTASSFLLATPQHSFLRHPIATPDTATIETRRSNNPDTTSNIIILSLRPFPLDVVTDSSPK